MPRKKKDYEPDNGPLTSKQIKQIKKSAPVPAITGKKVIESADIAETFKVKTSAKKIAEKVIEKAMTKPIVEVGSHLTVTTYPDGRKELKWDDEALLRDVRVALLKAESASPVTEVAKPKRTRKKA